MTRVASALLVGALAAAQASAAGDPGSSSARRGAYQVDQTQQSTTGDEETQTLSQTIQSLEATKNTPNLPPQMSLKIQHMIDQAKALQAQQA
ncbi:MAG: hypothetical protein KGL53_02175, partial [Elusimicrobia bacterium]|nr:hypothetical protein [Elusimicrobiota bacterium]